MTEHQRAAAHAAVGAIAAALHELIDAFSSGARRAPTRPAAEPEYEPSETDRAAARSALKRAGVL